MVDPVLVIGAIVAALGIAAFGFLYFVSNDESNSYDAGSRQKLLGIKPKNPNKKPKEGKQEKKSKKASKPKKDSSAKGKYRREMKKSQMPNTEFKILHGSNWSKYLENPAVQLCNPILIFIGRVNLALY